MLCETGCLIWGGGVHEQLAHWDTKSHWKQVLAWGKWCVGGISVLKVSGFPTLASPDQMRPRPKGWHTDTCGYFVYEKRGWAQEKLIRERERASG